jgi:glucose-6-phosphate-specific signal transduction histidine kinase
MAIDIDFDAAAAERFRIVADDDRVALALYRITEQALQNALKHGHATWARVALNLRDQPLLELIVEADGDAPSATRVAGNGTAIINAWLDDVGGNWSLAAGVASGSVFRASIALSR